MFAIIKYAFSTVGLEQQPIAPMCGPGGWRLIANIDRYLFAWSQRTKSISSLARSMEKSGKMANVRAVLALLASIPYSDVVSNRKTWRICGKITANFRTQQNVPFKRTKNAIKWLATTAGTTPIKWIHTLRRNKVAYIVRRSFRQSIIKILVREKFRLIRAFIIRRV